jgi:hypothetical protein
VEPLVVGAKPTVNGIDCWVGSVNGVVRLPRENAAPATVRAETVTDAVPVLVIATDWDCVLLTVTFPKLSVVGLDDKSPCGVGTPVPVSDTRKFWSAALLTKVMLPVALPVLVGVNTAV